VSHDFLPVAAATNDNENRGWRFASANLELSLQRKTPASLAIPGLEASDATAGLLTLRVRAVRPSFPEAMAPVDRVAGGSPLTVAGTVPDFHRIPY